VASLTTHTERILIAVLGAALAVGVTVGATLIAVDDGEPAEPNVILISIDTLRADHLGCYGYPIATSPAVDRFAEDAVLFEMTIAHAPSTEPSHASIFTSLLPIHHGAYFSLKAPLHDDHVTMAEILKQHGFVTKSFNDGAQVQAKWGFDQGFDEYTTLPGPPTEYTFRRTVEHTVAWLEDHRSERFFLFLHTYEPHHPYTPEARYYEAIGHVNRSELPTAISKQLLEELNRRFPTLGEEDKRHVIAGYDAEIRSMDDAFDTLISELARLDLYDDTLIVFTSDHGEELGERDRMGWHSHALFDEQLRVPLIVRLPGGRHAGRRVAAQVRSIDILPTVLDVLEIPLLEVFEGSTLMPLVRQPSGASRPAVSQRDVREPRGPVSLRTGDWKYYERTQIRRRLLFDVVRDPGERRDLAQQEPQRMRDLMEQLEGLLGDRPDGRYRGEIEIDDQLRRVLEELGYLK
jgi:arylsulfatase A-like enzyme